MNKQANAPPQPATALPASIRFSAKRSIRPDDAMPSKKPCSCVSVTASLQSYSVSPAPTAQAVLGMMRMMGQALKVLSCKAFSVTPAAMDTTTAGVSRLSSTGFSNASSAETCPGFTPRNT